jgi:hypothetical protein
MQTYREVRPGPIFMRVLKQVPGGNSLSRVPTAHISGTDTVAEVTKLVPNGLLHKAFDEICLVELRGNIKELDLIRDRNASSHCTQAKLQNS